MPSPAFRCFSSASASARAEAAYADNASDASWADGADLCFFGSCAAAPAPPSAGLVQTCACGAGWTHDFWVLHNDNCTLPVAMYLAVFVANSVLVPVQFAAVTRRIPRTAGRAREAHIAALFFLAMQWVHSFGLYVQDGFFEVASAGIAGSSFTAGFWVHRLLVLALLPLFGVNSSARVRRVARLLVDVSCATFSVSVSGLFLAAAGIVRSQPAATFNTLIVGEFLMGMALAAAALFGFVAMATLLIHRIAHLRASASAAATSVSSPSVSLRTDTGAGAGAGAGVGGVVVVAAAAAAGAPNPTLDASPSPNRESGGFKVRGPDEAPPSTPENSNNNSNNNINNARNAKGDSVLAALHNSRRTLFMLGVNVVFSQLPWALAQLALGSAPWAWTMLAVMDVTSPLMLTKATLDLVDPRKTDFSAAARASSLNDYVHRVTRRWRGRSSKRAHRRDAAPNARRAAADDEDGGGWCYSRADRFRRRARHYMFLALERVEARCGGGGE